MIGDETYRRTGGDGARALARPKVAAHLNGQEPAKVIDVPVNVSSLGGLGS